MSAASSSATAVCLTLARAMSRTRTVEEIYETALDALSQGLGVSRAAVLLFDADDVMRFVAHRGVSAIYRATVEGHTPWRPDAVAPAPIVVADVGAEASLAAYLPAIRTECIAAMAFIPLVSMNRVIGKFMLYYNTPYQLSDDELQLACLIASFVAFAVERTRTEEQARQSEERLRFALDAASMGTWDWDMTTHAVRWSDNLERLHGLAPGTFDGTFASYQREIHPDDRERLQGAIRQAIADGLPFEAEYRIVAPDGSVRWCESTGRVEFRDRRPVRMTGVCMMVTARKEAELARLGAAEEASRVKDEFLAVLSHELRTPLNAILGWVQILDAGLAPDRVRQAIDVIGRNARLQAQLIEDILDVSRIITGKLELDRRPVLIAQLIDTALAGSLPAATAKRIDLVKVVAEDLPPVEGDPRRLLQVLGNVLSNAIKFTPGGGRVEIHVVSTGIEIDVEVRDTGAGIAPDLLPYVFDRFRQGESGSTRRQGGLGLGLAIARHLVGLHGGEIHAESDGPGRGTTITIRLPAGSRALAATAESPVIDETRERVRLEGARIVVVDDQRDARDLLATLFERHGASVVKCDSVDAALAAMGGARVDLLVADIAMPDIDGYELVRRAKALKPELPAVAVSAHARAEDRGRALASGYDGYCAKPIDTPSLLRTVRAVLLS